MNPLQRALSLSLIITPFALAACGSTPGAQPHDMSVAQHEAMAKQEDQAAAGHQAQQDPNAPADQPCTSSGKIAVDPCWTKPKSPTHPEEAELHRKRAAEHRAASQALRDAEARACVGISETDRDMSPFHHRDDIVSVETLKEAENPKKPAVARGAIITFRAVPGLTAQWLQRVLDCHIARNASLGHEVPEMPYCPLVPKGVTASVAEVHGAFAVTIRSTNADGVRDVVSRAVSLKEPEAGR